MSEMKSLARGVSPVGAEVSSRWPTTTADEVDDRRGAGEGTNTAVRKGEVFSSGKVTITIDRPHTRRGGTL